MRNRIVFFLIALALQQGSVSAQLPQPDTGIAFPGDHLTAERILHRIDSLYRITLYTDALQETMNLLTYALETRDTYLEIKAYQITGDLMRSVGDYLGALQYLDKIFLFDEGIRDAQLMATTWNLKAAVYFEKPVLGHLDTAWMYAEKSLALAKLTGDSALICSNYIIMGSSALNQNDFAVAGKFLDNALAIAIAINLERDLPLIRWHLAELYEKQGKYAQAEQMALQAFHQAKQDSIHVYVYLLSEFLRQFYLKQGNTEQNFRFLTELIQSRNRIQMEKTKRQITLLEASLVMAEKEKENQQLRVLEAENSRKLQISLFLALFLVLLVVAAVTFVIITLRRKRLLNETYQQLISVNKALQQQKEQTEQMAQELHSSNAMLKRFISIIAHDLKNPFNSIIGFTDLLKNEFHDLTDQEKELAIDNVYKASVNAFALLEQLLEWARLQTGSLKMHPERCNLTALMQQVTSTLHASIELKYLVLETRMTDELIVSGDANMIQTIFRNLLSNAIKFTPESGRITIDGIRDEHSIVVTVSDTGVGIPAEHLHKLFSMDEQYTMPGTNNEKGTGLGLILCREYMEQHGGTITVTSTTGKGSAFTVTFPAA